MSASRGRRSIDDILDSDLPTVEPGELCTRWAMDRAALKACIAGIETVRPDLTSHRRFIMLRAYDAFLENFDVLAEAWSDRMFGRSCNPGLAGWIQDLHRGITSAAYDTRKARGEFTLGWWVVMDGDVVVAHERMEHIARKKMGQHTGGACLILEVGAEDAPVRID